MSDDTLAARARRLASWIEKADPDLFAMRQALAWRGGVPSDIPGHAFALARGTDRIETDGDLPSGIADVARDWLGLDERRARALFWPDNAHACYAHGPWHRRHVRNVHAAAVLRHLAETGEIDWSVGRNERPVARTPMPYEDILFQWDEEIAGGLSVTELEARRDVAGTGFTVEVHVTEIHPRGREGGVSIGFDMSRAEGERLGAFLRDERTGRERLEDELGAFLGLSDRAQAGPVADRLAGLPNAEGN